MNQNRPNKEKWLFFVNSLERQEVLAKELSEKTKKKIDRFDSSKKNNTPVWKKLIDGTIPNDVLLTTSALDNGLNITDPLFHNIVIEFTDRVSFLQILGRKRVGPGEKINIFVQVPTKEMIEKRYRNIHDMLLFLEAYKISPYNFLQYNWGRFERKYRNLFWINDEQKLIVNGFAQIELQRLLEFYGNLLFQMQQQTDFTIVRDLYPRQVLGWMGLDKSIEWVSEAEISNAVESLKNLLEKNIESGIPNEQCVEFFELFYQLASIILRPEKIKNDYRSGPSIMSKALQEMANELGTCYSITGKGTWRIEKRKK